MNILALKAPSALALRPRWPVHLSWLALTAFAIRLIFASDAMGMADIWSDASAMGHSLLMPCILSWLVQQRLSALRQLTRVAWSPGLLLAGAGALHSLVGCEAGVGLAA